MSISIDAFQMLTSMILDSGSFAIPNILFKYYARLGITEAEMIVLIHLIYWRNTEHEPFPSPEKISQYMQISSEEIKNLIASLIEKKLLTVEPYYNSTLGRWQNTFAFKPLWTKLAQIAVGDYSIPTKSHLEMASSSEKHVELYQLFEKEFGRPLSPLESDQLKTWLQDEQLTANLLQEALKRAVLRGALNFRYIDSILRDWQRNNIHTVTDTVNHDNKRKRKHRLPRSESKTPSKKDKYRELYRLNTES